MGEPRGARSGRPAATPARRPFAWPVLAGIGAAAAIGLLFFYRNWQQLNADGPSYLDMGSELLGSGLRRGWSAHWSPLYGILAAIAARVAESVAPHPLTGVQALNAAFYLANLAACVHLAGAVLGAVPQPYPDGRAAAIALAPLGLFLSLAVRFRWAVLVTPDLAVSLVALLAAAITVRSFARGFRRPNAALLGVCFGIGYWFKAILFPLFFWWLLLAAWLLRRRRAELRGLVTCVAVWLLLAAPLVAIVSHVAGRLTIGEAGRHAYIWYVRQSFYIERADGRWPESNRLLHPVPIIRDDPKIYLFGDKFSEATYGLWYKPDYWQAGYDPRLSWPWLLGAFRKNLRELWAIWTSKTLTPYLLLIIVGLLSIGARIREPALLFCLLYSSAPVFGLLWIHAEMRFFYAQFAILALAGAISLTLHPRLRRHRWPVLAVAAISLWGFLISAVRGVPAVESKPAARAEAAWRGGVRQGMKVCTIADLSDSPWAWYARVRVMAELPLAEYRRLAGSGRKLGEEVIEGFRSAGCQAAVAILAEDDPPPEGWPKPAASPVYVRLLAPAQASSPWEDP